MGEGSPLQRQTGSRHVLDLQVPEQRWFSDVPVTSVLLVVQTGDDDLRGGSDNADAILNYASGSTTTTDINRNGNWKNGDTHTISLDYPPGLRESDITGVAIKTNFGGGIGGDNWNIQKVALVVSRGAGGQISVPAMPVVHRWLDVSDGPLLRFTGSHHDKTISVKPQDLGAHVNQLELILSTGNDDLHGGSNPNDNCDVTILLSGGGTISLKNVNQGQRWKGWTDHPVDIPIPAPGLVGGDVTGITVHTGFGGGSSGDNWNLQRVQLIATLRPSSKPIVYPVGQILGH